MKKKLDYISLLFERYILLFSSIFIILPFLFVSLFIHPYGDDFTFNYITQELGYIDAQAYWYNQGNGRYFSSLILSIPFIAEFPFYVYKLLPIILIILTILSTIFFLKSILINVPNRTVGLISLIIFSLYLFSMPSVTEGFYWAASSITYQLSLSLSLLFFTLWINYLKSKSIYFLISTFLIFVCIFGSNETNFIITFLITLSAIILDVVKRKNISKINFLLLFLGILLITLSIKAPGNTVRIDNLEKSKDLIGSAFLTLGKLIQLIMDVLPLLIISLYVGFKLKIKIRLIPELKMAELLNPWNTFFITIFILSAGIFPSYYILGKPPNRVMNIICFYFIFYFFFLTSNVNFEKIPLKIRELLQKDITMLIAIILILYKFYTLNNVKTAYAEILKGKIAKYDRELEERYKILKSCKTDTCYVPKVKAKPRTIFFNDIAEFENDWRNLHYADQFGKMQILVKKLNIEK